MLRKIAFAAVAAASLGVVAFSPTSASAGYGWHGGGWHGHHHHRWGGPRFYIGGGPAYYAGGGCYVKRLVSTPWGYRYRLVNRCY